MRIVGGEWRGHPIDPPKGREVSRPTTDRVREALASMLESALDGGFAGTRVLDAFAGSGALGIELLSRGAEHVSFFDVDRRASALVRHNLERVGCASTRYHAVCGDVLASAERGRIPGAPFGLVLMDPPYALGTAPAERLLAALAEHGCLEANALAVFERTSTTPALEVTGFELLKSKRYGQTCIDLLRRG